MIEENFLTHHVSVVICATIVLNKVCTIYFLPLAAILTGNNCKNIHLLKKILNNSAA